MFIVFENPGEIDPRTITTFGVSVKENENPIGYFGTGLKYAIAILMRHKCQLSVWSGKEGFKFEIQDKEIRGKIFEIITMGGSELPFTTELGKNWELWQAFRELYCNAIDENGKVYLSSELPEPQNDKTFIVVKSREFENVFHKRDEIVLNIDPNQLLASGDVMIYDKPSEYVYYRGIRVAGLQSPAKLTYNLISEIELTEDRTMKYSYEMGGRIPRAVAKIKNKQILHDILTTDEDCYERELDFDFASIFPPEVSDEFLEVVGTQYHLNNDNLNKSARTYFQKRMNKEAAKHYEREELNHVQQKQLNRCKDICKILYSDFDSFDLMVVKSLGQNTLALADAANNTMIISMRCFEFGTKYLLSTIIEEYAHLKTGYRDHSRELQTWLFDQLCTVIENHVIEEPI